MQPTQLLKTLVETESPSHDKAAVDRVGAIVAEESRKLGAQIEVVPGEPTLVRWPVESGHGCLGCSEPDFWDGGGFYKALSMPANPLKLAAGAAVAGAAAGVAISFANRAKKGAAKSAHVVTPSITVRGLLNMTGLAAVRAG